MTTQQSVEKYTMTARALLDRVGFVLSTTQLFDYFDQMYSNSAKLNDFIFQSALMHGFRCEYATWSVTLNLADHFVVLGRTQHGTREQYFAVEFYGKAVDPLEAVWVCDNMEMVQNLVVSKPQIKIPTPQEVLNSPAVTGFHLTALKEITRKLSDPDWVRDWRCGGSEDPFWRIAVPGVASHADMIEIERVLSGSGWHRIVQTNSGDNGERDGMYGVTFSAKPLKTEE